LPDATTSRLQQFVDHWRTTTSLSDSEVTSLIRRDSLDILVDLAGHTARNRLLVFPARPAALQLSWLGYPNTTGLSSIDLRVTDSTCVPLGSEAELGAEAVLRIDPFFSVYQPPAEIPEIDARKSATGSIRFCSFNNLAKLSEPTLTLWAEILKEIPDSCMLLKSPGAEDTETQSLIRARFEAASISPSRIRFDGRRLRMKDHLCLYNTCDIALDPFPYNGTTTTCEALLMSLPVVALAGKSHASRVGTSLLYAIGLPELIAESSADYLKIAVGLARDSNRLLMLRSSVRQRFIKSPICDAVAFTAKWEASLLLELERRGLHFAVDRT
jgi:predicted O-linked N-acetylglucosamine transferase (SPINDLY family)